MNTSAAIQCQNYFTVRNVVIEANNGSGAAIDTWAHALVENVTEIGNSGVAAIEVHAHSIIRSVNIFGGYITALTGTSISDSVVNADAAVPTNGISCAARCNIRGNIVSSAGLIGIVASTGSHVQDNVVTGSGGDGISVATSSVVLGNSSNGNGGDGIAAGNASTIRNNSADSNTLDGIDAGDGSNVSENTARSNGEFGLRAESTLVGFSRNVFGNNNGGSANDQTSSGRDLGGNQCDSAAICP